MYMSPYLEREGYLTYFDDLCILEPLRVYPLGVTKLVSIAQCCCESDLWNALFSLFLLRSYSRNPDPNYEEKSRTGATIAPQHSANKIPSCPKKEREKAERSDSDSETEMSTLVEPNERYFDDDDERRTTGEIPTSSRQNGRRSARNGMASAATTKTIEIGRTDGRREIH